MELIFTASRLKGLLAEVRSKDRSRSTKRTKASYSVGTAAISSTDTRARTGITDVTIPADATFDDVLALMAQTFRVQDGKLLRVGKLKYVILTLSKFYVISLKSII